MNKYIKFTWDDWKWIALIIMLGVNMYWTALIVQPTLTSINQNQQILNETMKQTENAATNVEEIIEHQDNSTKALQTIIESTQALRDNQVVLVRELDNMSADLGTKSDSIDQNSKVLVLQSAGIQNLMDWAAGNFSEAEEFNKQWEHDDRMRSLAILGNISDMERTLRYLEAIADRGNPILPGDQVKGFAAFNRTVNVTQ